MDMQICIRLVHSSGFINFFGENLILQICSVLYKMASQTQGIQQLLAAEKKAAEKVSQHNY